MLDMNDEGDGYSCQASMGDESRKGELLQGTLPLLILRTLDSGPSHGFDIARRIQQVSKSVLKVQQGSLYPALHRMELDGLIESCWNTTENNRQAKYYKLTRRGIRRLAAETERWQAIAAAIAAVLQEA